MFGGSKKPYSAITVQVDRLTSEQYEEDDVSGIIDLIEVIRIQTSGPTEAARALRKKLKYGDPHRQIRALVILDGLIQNAGTRFQKAFADEPLLDRLRQMARDEAVDAQVKQKCRVLFIQWANAYKNTSGLQSIAQLYKELPKSQKPAIARQKVLKEADNIFETDEERAERAAEKAEASRPRATSSAQSPPTKTTPSRPVTLTPTSSGLGSKLSKGKKPAKFNLAKERENITKCIAQASIASTNLLNGLQLINRENERISQNKEIVNRFEICKSLRRQILVYIQQVESDDWIGSLVDANDQLIKALTAYEIMDKSIDDDSDSDAEQIAHVRHTRTISRDTQHQLAGLSLEENPPVKPPRPAAVPMPSPPKFAVTPSTGDNHRSDNDEDDDDNPFGDSNAVATPHNELRGMTWKEV